MAVQPDELVDQAFDAGADAANNVELAEAIAQLAPEEAEFFLHRLEAALRKRKIQLFGYLTAMLVWLVGMMAALVYYGTAQTGHFVGWVFIMPFGLVGAVLYGFGTWAARVGARAGLPKAAVKPTAAVAAVVADK